MSGQAHVPTPIEMKRWRWRS